MRVIIELAGAIVLFAGLILTGAAFLNREPAVQLIYFQAAGVLVLIAIAFILAVGLRREN